MLSEGAALADDIAQAAPDRRAGGKRHQSVLLVGKVARGGEDSACLVHDISRHGLMARFPVPPVIGETLVIEVRGLPAAEGIVRWVNGRKAGFQFTEAQDVEQVFRVKRADGMVARPPRFPLFVRAALRLDGERLRAETLDISAGGIKLACDAPIQAGQTGQVTLVDTGTSLFGKVCWARDGHSGFRFMAPLPLDALAQILTR